VQSSVVLTMMEGDDDDDGREQRGKDKASSDTRTGEEEVESAQFAWWEQERL